MGQSRESAANVVPGQPATSRYDDELWSLVPEPASPPGAHLAAFVGSLEPVGAALDLGCGDGRLSEMIPASELTLADVSAVALDRARRRLPSARAVQIEVDGALPVADGSFDLVVCTETIEHVRDLQLLLSEVRRVLRPRGRLALSTPAHGRRTGLELAVGGFERRFDPLSPHLRFLTRRSLARLLDAMGFELVSQSRAGGTLFAVATR